MKEYIQKIKTWLENTKSSRISYEKKVVKPERDWRIILFVVFVFLCLSVLYSFYLYRKVNNGEMLVTVKNDIEQNEKINTNLLKKVIEDIKNREDFIRQLKNNNLIPSDPSI